MPSCRRRPGAEGFACEGLHSDGAAGPRGAGGDAPRLNGVWAEGGGSVGYKGGGRGVR